MRLSALNLIVPSNSEFQHAIAMFNVNGAYGRDKFNNRFDSNGDIVTIDRITLLPTLLARSSIKAPRLQPERTNSTAPVALNVGNRMLPSRDLHFTHGLGHRKNSGMHGLGFGPQPDGGIRPMGSQVAPTLTGQSVYVPQSTTRFTSCPAGTVYGGTDSQGGLICMTVAAPPPAAAPVVSAPQATTISPNFNVSPVIQTTVSPQISPVFQQSYMPSGSPMTAGTTQTSPNTQSGRTSGQPTPPPLYAPAPMFAPGGYSAPVPSYGPGYSPPPSYSAAPPAPPPGYSSAPAPSMPSSNIAPVSNRFTLQNNLPLILLAAVGIGGILLITMSKGRKK